MSAGYEIVPYGPAFREEVLALQRHLWGPDPERNARYLEWKHERNPYLRGPLFHLALAGGRPVGMRGMYGACFEAAGQRHVVPCAGDVVIAPGHRTRGLFAALSRAAERDLAERGFPFAFNLSAAPTTMMGSLALGWRAVGPLEKWTRRPGAPRRLLDRVRPRRARGVRVEDAPRPEAMADLVAKLGTDGRVRHVRDAEFLAWRFRNPLSDYRFFFREREEGLAGYLVAQSHWERPDVGHLVDWEAADGETRTALLDAALATLDGETLSVWVAPLAPEPRRLLSGAGFAPEDRGGFLGRARPTVLVKRVDGADDWSLAGRPLLSPASWDARMVYSDAY